MRVLHIGMPKTGSTALQEAIAQLGLLANENSDGTGKDPEWGIEAAGFRMNREKHERITPNIAALPEAMVVSDEDLCLADRAQAKAISAALFPAFILLITRPLADLAESWWAEMVKHGETRTLEAWMQDVVFDDPRRNVEARRVRCDYAAHAWQPTTIREYDLDLLPWFNKSFMRGYPFADNTFSNTSLSPEATEVVRRWQAVTNGTHEEVQYVVSCVAKIDEPTTRLLDQRTRAQLMRYDQEIGYAITDGGIAQLAPIPIATRHLDETRIKELLTAVEN